MYSLLPLLIFAAALLHFLGQDDRKGISYPWQRAFLYGALLSGFLAWLIIEGLSPFNLVTRTWTVATWSAAAIVVGIFIYRSGAYRLGFKRMKHVLSRPADRDQFALVGSALLFGLLLVVAVISPPNNVDSLRYHMSRVMHWAQNHSLAHYPTSYEPQLIMPPYAEMAILNLRLLRGNDQLANLVQWFSLIGCIVGVSSLADLLGANRKGRIQAAVFALTIPMALLQGTSTQNDLVTAFWLVTLGFLVFQSQGAPREPIEMIALGIALGLGMLTKATFYVFAFPIMTWYLLRKTQNRRTSQTLLHVFLPLGIAVSINAGYWIRNIDTYGSPLGQSAWAEKHLAFLSPVEAFETLASPPASGNDENVDELRGLDGIISNTSKVIQGLVSMEAKLFVRNFTLPLVSEAAVADRTLRHIPEIFDPPFIQTLSDALWNHEDTAGSPLHILLILATIPPVYLPKFKRSKLARSYTLAALTGFLLLPLIFRDPSSLYGVRFQLPFLILWAPIYGDLAGSLIRPWLGTAVMVILFLAALPIVVLNNTRPLLGLKPTFTRTESIFIATEADLIFASAPELQDDYLEIGDFIRHLQCTRIGLVLGSQDLEYLIWWLFGGAQEDLRIENLQTPDPLLRYQDIGFQPCAILCTRCDAFKDKDLLLDLDYIRLYK